MLLAVLAATLGVMLMVADERPVDKKFTEKVAVRPYTGSKFLDPHKDIAAFPMKLAGGDGWVLNGGLLWEAGTEIIQADGTVWEVIKSYDAAPEVRCTVKKKSDPPKKKD